MIIGMDTNGFKGTNGNHKEEIMLKTNGCGYCDTRLDTTGRTANVAAFGNWYELEQCWNCDAPGARRRQIAASFVSRIAAAFAQRIPATGKTALLQNAQCNK